MANLHFCTLPSQQFILAYIAEFFSCVSSLPVFKVFDELNVCQIESYNDWKAKPDH